MEKNFPSSWGNWEKSANITHFYQLQGGHTVVYYLFPVINCSGSMCRTEIKTVSLHNLQWHTFNEGQQLLVRFLVSHHIGFQAGMPLQLMKQTVLDARSQWRPVYTIWNQTELIFPVSFVTISNSPFAEQKVYRNLHAYWQEKCHQVAYLNSA